MITILSLLVALSAPAQAKAPASCMGKTGNELTICIEQRATEQASQLAAAKRQLEALEAQCAQACDNNSTPAQSAPSAPRSTGPSRTYLVLDAYGKRLDALEAALTAGVDVEVDLTGIQRELDLIGETLNDHEERLDEIEEQFRNPPIATPPIYVPAAPATPTPGPAGKDGKDGSGEFSTSVGVTTAAGEGWGHTGLELALTGGGRPTDWLVLGGYASGHIFAADSLGFAAGGAATIHPQGWAVQFPVEVGWREAGIHFVDGDAQRAIQGIELRGGVGVVADVGFTARITVGGWFPGGDDGSALIGQASAGWRF